MESIGRLGIQDNSFLLLAISILRLFGNEEPYSKRSPYLHMARVSAV
jgi:hypothetical protein